MHRRRSERARSFRVVPVGGMLAVHGQTFGGTSFVNYPFKQTANRGVGEWPLIICFRIGEDFRLAGRLIQRDVCLLLQVTDLESTLAALVQQFHQFLVDLVHATAPVGNVHGSASRRDRPRRAASLKECTRLRNALRAAPSVGAFSISETSAEPMT